MGKQIVVKRDEVRKATYRLERLIARDPLLRKEKRELEQLVKREKARRDAERAPRQSRTSAGGRESRR